MYATTPRPHFPNILIIIIINLVFNDTFSHKKWITMCLHSRSNLANMLFKDAVQSDLRTKEPSFYYTNSLFRFLFHFMVLQSLIVVSW